MFAAIMGMLATLMHTLRNYGLAALWGTRRANLFVRIFVPVALFWPVVPAIVSATGVPSWITAIVALSVPLAGLGWVLLRWPLLTAALAAIPGRTREFVGGLFLLGFYEFGVGLFFTLVPAKGDPSKIAPLMLVGVSILSLFIGTRLAGVRIPFQVVITWGLIIVLLSMAASFYQDEDAVAQGTSGGTTSAPAMTFAGDPTALPVCAGQPDSWDFRSPLSKRFVLRDDCTTGWIQLSTREPMDWLVEPDPGECVLMIFWSGEDFLLCDGTPIWFGDTGNDIGRSRFRLASAEDHRVEAWVTTQVST